MIIKNNTPIVDLEDWRIRGRPKSPEHWAEGRSAMETARHWLAAIHPAFPPEISALLASNPEFGPVEDWRAEPEVKLSFDGFRGETRNADLVVQARDANGEFFMAIEAKADERFSETVSEALAAALERKLKNTPDPTASLESSSSRPRCLHPRPRAPDSRSSVPSAINS